MWRENKMPESHTDVQDLPAGYRMTGLGPLPEEWRVVRLGEIARYINGYAFKPSDWSMSGRPIIRIQNLTGTSTKVNYFEGSIDKRYLVNPGDILISWSASLDVFIWSGEQAWLNQHIFKVTDISPQCNKFFLFFVVKHIIGNIRSRTHGSTMKHITRKEFLRIPIPLPPLSEQRAIAHVLRAVQEAREATERVIAALRDLKRSLMRHLFTYGPVPVDQADQVALQDTPIGPIPAHWRVVRLGEVVTTFQYGLSVRAEREGRYPMLRMNNLEDGRVTTSDLKYINLSSAEATRFLLRPGDLLFNRTNSRDLVGKTALFDLDGKYVFASYLIRMSVDRSNIEPRFLNFLLNYAPVQQRLKSIATRGVSQANISASKLKAFAVSLPPLDEQRQIARILQTVDRKIEAEENRKRALDDLFKTLLHHLMTAKIRVPREAVKEFESLGIPGP
jgi:type I restriction enzyme S subunit